MISSVRWVSIALLAVLAAASACPAAESTGAAPGRGGVGGQLGGSFFYMAGDYSEGARSRFDFAGNLRYVFGSALRLQVSPGFTWSGYSSKARPPFVDPNFPADQDKKHYLTLLAPVSAQLQYTFTRGVWHWHIGAGPGVYRVWVEDHRKVLKDPVTFRLHRGTYPGGTAEIGVERFFKVLPSTSIEVSAANHYVFAVRDQQFPSGWNDNLGAIGVRVGANYYFDVNRQKPKTELPHRRRGRK